MTPKQWTAFLNKFPKEYDVIAKYCVSKGKSPEDTITFLSCTAVSGLIEMYYELALYFICTENNIAYLLDIHNNIIKYIIQPQTTN